MRLLVAYSSQSRLLDQPISHAVDPERPLWNGKPGRSRQRAICGSTVAGITYTEFDADAVERPCRLCAGEAARRRGTEAS